MRLVAVCCVLTACAGVNPGPGDLTLDGPAEVHVRQLGPVEEAPELRAPDGTVITPQYIAAIPESVARISDGMVHAVGAGTATIILVEDQQELTWTLVVQPQPTVSFVEPPAQLRVGERHPLTVKTSSGDTDITWSSHDDSIAAVDERGQLVTHTSGRVWITAKDASGAEAMVEILVVTPDR